MAKRFNPSCPAHSKTTTFRTAQFGLVSEPGIFNNAKAPGKSSGPTVSMSTMYMRVEEKASPSSSPRSFFGRNRDKLREAAANNKNPNPSVAASEESKSRDEREAHLLRTRINTVRSHIGVLQQLLQCEEYEDDGTRLRTRIGEEQEKIRALQAQIDILEPAKPKTKRPSWNMREKMFLHSVGNL